MTRPTPTQTAQSEAVRVPRVSDDELAQDLLAAEYHERCDIGKPVGQTVSCGRDRYALDLHDERAKVADLERRLAEAEREPTCDAIIESWRFQAEAANARADALQARLTEAEQRAATAERRGFEACQDAAALFRRAIEPFAKHLDYLAMTLPAPIYADGTTPIYGADRVTGDEPPFWHALCSDDFKLADEAYRALAPAVPQEGETTP